MSQEYKPVAVQEPIKVWLLWNTEDDEAVTFFFEKPSEVFKDRFELREYCLYANATPCARCKERKLALPE